MPKPPRRMVLQFCLPLNKWFTLTISSGLVNDGEHQNPRASRWTMKCGFGVAPMEVIAGSRRDPAPARQARKDREVVRGGDRH